MRYNIFSNATLKRFENLPDEREFGIAYRVIAGIAQLIFKL